VSITAESQVFQKCLSQKVLISNSVDHDGANACPCIMLMFHLDFNSMFPLVFNAENH